MRILPVFLLAAIGCAAPAEAQIVGRPDYGPVAPSDPFVSSGFAPGPGIGREVRHIRERIGQAREAGLITRREARRLHREARLIGRLVGRYGRDGLSASERGELERRAAVLRGQIAR